MNNKALSSIIGVFVSFYILHDVPVVSLIYPGSVYAIVTLGAFVLLTLSINWANCVRLLPFFIIPLGRVLVDLSVSSIVSVIQLMICPLAGLYVLQTENKKLGKVFLLLFFILQFITCITTSTGLRDYPLASRMQASGDATEHPEYMIYKSLNIGGFDFIYTLVVLFPLILLSWDYRAVIFQIKNKILQRYLFPIALIVLVAWTIFSSQFTTAIIVIIFCSLLLFIRNKVHVWKMIIISLLAFTMFTIFKPIIATGIISISQLTESKVVSERLNDVGLSLQGKTTESEDYDERQRVWNLSITTFGDNPLGTWKGSGGGHSFFLDSLAWYGIMGIIAIIVLIHSTFTRLIKPLHNWRLYNCALFVFFAFFITALLNPHPYYNALLFIMPLFFYIFFDVRLIVNNNR